MKQTRAVSQPAVQPLRAWAGFSLVELLTVVAVLLAVSAVAIPSVVTSVANIRLRSGMSSLAGLIQGCRMNAIKTNTKMTVNFGVLSYGPVAYVKPAGDTSARASTDLQAELGAPVSKVSAPTSNPTPLTASILWGSSSSPLDTTHNVTFNARGLPCYYVNASTCTNTGFVFYFTDSRPLGNNGWAAISISPAGRVKTWMWNGSSWEN